MSYTKQLLEDRKNLQKDLDVVLTTINLMINSEHPDFISYWRIQLPELKRRQHLLEAELHVIDSILLKIVESNWEK